jgi:hypothetical protein
VTYKRCVVIIAVGRYLVKLKFVAASVALVVAGAASAATFNGVVGPGLFEVDLATFSFSAGQKALVSFGVGSSPVDITVPLTPTLSMPVHYDALTFSGATIQGTSNPAVSMTDADLSNGSFFTVIAPGTYMLKFAGTSLTGGFYSGEYNVSISSVPEPESLALALAGCGVMFSVMHRRKRA